MSKSIALLQAKQQFDSGGGEKTTGPPFAGFTPNAGGQSEFFEMVPIDRPVELPYKILALRGGIGSGKSLCGAAFACSRARLDPHSRGLISANDYQQLRTSTLVALAEFCAKFNIPLRPWVEGDADATAEAIANKRSCKIFDAHVLVVSANKFTGTTKKAKEGGRGLQIRWFWGDEWAYAHSSAFTTVNGRLGRGEGSLKALGLITSSPNKNQPYNWLYDYFDNPSRSAELRHLYRSIVLDTRENLQFLGADYVQSLEATYTDELALLELRGQYASLSTGRVYKYFDRPQHMLMGADQIPYDRSLDLHISLDFNWNPATAVIAQTHGEELIFIKEFRLANSDTFEMGKTLIAWILGLRHDGEIYLYGDASGNSRSANSKKTNWEIIWDAFKGAGWRDRCHRRYGKSNPGILDSVLSVNNLFKQGRCYLNEDCAELAKDLEQVQWRNDAGTEIDKSDNAVTHLSDCARYLVSTLFSYKKQTIKPGRREPIQIEGVPF